MSLRILVADDHAVVRAGLRQILAEPGFEIVGEASDGEEAVLLALRLAPAVVVMDLQMPKLDGIAATKRIRAARPDVHVVLLTTFESEADVARAVDAGASGYVLKDASRDFVVQAVRAAAQGQPTFSPQAASHLVSRARGGASALTRRETSVLEHVAKGASNRDIAAALRVSEATVKTHLLHVFEKLGVDDRTRAVTVALERKLLRL